jgi:4-hydroxy-2-oxoheptanedioate aldolase
LPAGLAPVLVRVAANESDLIGRALDAGADGILVPTVESPAAAAAAVAACRYPPQGTRSWGPLASLTGRSVPGPAAANARVACGVMIETPAAVRDAARIAAVPGVDAVFVGPYDLALASGIALADLLADRSDSSPLRQIVRACGASGVAVGAFGGTAPQAQAMRELGFTMIATATDTGLLAHAAAAAAPGAPAPAPVGYAVPGTL